MFYYSTYLSNECLQTYLKLAGYTLLHRVLAFKLLYNIEDGITAHVN